MPCVNLRVPVCVKEEETKGGTDQWFGEVMISRSDEENLPDNTNNVFCSEFRQVTVEVLGRPIGNFETAFIQNLLESRGLMLLIQKQETYVVMMNRHQSGGRHSGDAREDKMGWLS